MTKTFDPYYRWLGIPPREQPPHLYRLLGLELFESDPDVIDSMASRHIEYLQEINDGPHLQRAQQLLNELTAARRTLLTAEAKAAYDATLKATLESERKPPVAAPPESHSSTRPIVPPPAGNKLTASPSANHGIQDRHKTGKSAARPAATHSGRKRGSVSQVAANKRRNVLAACGLTCLIVLLAVGIRLGGRDEERDELIPSITGRSVKDQPVADQTRAEQPSESETHPTNAAQSPRIEEQADDAPDPLPPADDTIVPHDSDHAQSQVARESPETAQPTLPTAGLADVPTDGLLLWLDAADPQTMRMSDNQQLRHWYDKSANEYRASLDSDGSGPELVPGTLGDKPTVRFSGADWLKIDRTLDLMQDRAEYTFVYVARGAVGTVISNGMGDDNPFSFALAPGVTGFQLGGRQLDAESESSIEFHVRSLVVDTNSVRWFVDSQPCGRFDAPQRAIEKANVLRIGCSYRNRHGAESIFQGDLAELMIYGRALADDDRQRLEAAARAKWLSGPVAAFPFDVPEPSIAAEDTDIVSEANDMENSETIETNDVVSDAETSPSDDAESARHSQEFVTLTPVQMDASAGTTFQLRDDGALLADGQNTTEETYRITFEANIPGMTAILLEALPDDSLPGKGPGLSTGGVFSLAEISVAVKARDDSGPGETVTFWQTRADDSQAKLSNDGDTATRWTARRRAERVPVVYVAEEPFGDLAGSVLAVTIVQRENLGCFRVSATSAEEPWKLPVPTEASENNSDDGSALFVNLGGDTWQEPGGARWLESKSFTGSSFGHEGGQSVKTDETPHVMLATARRGIVAFRAEVEPGDYEIRLYFSEHWTSEPRDRLFSVFIEQRPALPPRLGIGFGQPYIHHIPRVHVSESPLDIDFLPAREGAKTILNGVSIRRLK